MTQIVGVCAALAMMVVGVWLCCEFIALAKLPEPDWGRMGRLLLAGVLASFILGSLLERVLP